MLLRTLSNLDDLDYYGKKVLMRVDFNVTIGKDNEIGEDYRIRMTIPTIEYLTKRGAKLILMSHLGRPKNKEEKEYKEEDKIQQYSISDLDINVIKQFSLAPVAKRLSELIQVYNVSFIEDCIGSLVHKEIAKMERGDILLLENLRFYKGEELNDYNFSKELASLADIYVNDAFSVSHRKHASIYGAARLFDKKLAGLNLKKELEYLSMVKDDPVKPFILVVGGSKIKDKIGALENLLPKVDKLLVGGAMAYTFLNANGVRTGDSPIDYDHFQWVKNALLTYREKIVLPIDHIVTSESFLKLKKEESKEKKKEGKEEDDNSKFDSLSSPVPSPSLVSSSPSSLVSLNKGAIEEGLLGVDIGIETVQQYSSTISQNRNGMIVWIGPMGVFEIGLFRNGTNNIAKSMALAFWRGSKTIIGGGDTLDALKKAEVSELEVTHVSTGGGATLKFLAGDEMPGIEVLNKIN
ncbi:MAG: phosphoglycerate kinase [Nitrososphaeraceae archaeon]|nr:phosphoglycerate kinase [Nitrososphaeraceae archaeon]